MESRFKQGDVVYDKVRPSQRLIVQRSNGRIYFCKAEEHPKNKLLVYMEGDLDQTVK